MMCYGCVSEADLKYHDPLQIEGPLKKIIFNPTYLYSKINGTHEILIYINTFFTFIHFYIISVSCKYTAAISFLQ